MEFTGERYIPDQTAEDDELSVEHLHRYHAFLSLAKGKTVLDIACGEGYGSALLCQKAAYVVGIDIDDACIAHAREKYSPALFPGLDFQKGNMTSLPLGDRQFDLVISFETIEHIDRESQEKFLQEIKRVLKRDGVAVISTPNKENYSERYKHNNPFHKHEMGRVEFYTLLKNHFHNILMLGQGFEIISLISPEEKKAETSLQEIRWNKKRHTDSTKYHIAVVSDKKLQADCFSTVVINSGKTYFAQTDRILQLQEEVENLSDWGLRLERANNENISKLKIANEQLQVQSNTIDKEITDKISIRSLLESSVNQKEKEIQRLGELVTQHENRIREIEIQLERINQEKGLLGKKLDEAEIVIDKKSQQVELMEVERKDLVSFYTGQISELENRHKDSLNIQEKKQVDLNRQLDQTTKEMVALRGQYERTVNQYRESEKLMAYHKELIGNLQAASESQLNALDISEKRMAELQKISGQAQASLSEKLELQSESINRLGDRNKKLETETELIAGQLKEKKALVDLLISESTMVRSECNQANEKLATIYGSDGWKLLQRYYRLKGKFLPEKSVQYRLLRSMVRMFMKKQKLTPGFFVNQGESPLVPKVENNTTGIITTLPVVEECLVSIIIPVYNAWEMNHACIQSIVENTGDVPYEIIVADDCSTDDTRYISTRFPNIVHIRNKENLGFLLNCNQAARKARGKYFHFLNNDTRVRPGWLSSLVRLMENDDKIGMTGSKLIYPDGRLQEAGGIIWKDASGWNFGHHQDPDLPQFNYVKEVDYISGASILVRSDLWKQIGGFDERYAPAYCEDSDFSFELRKRGYKVVYQPSSEVIHYEGYSHGSDQTGSAISNIKKYQAENNRKFFEKWKDELAGQFNNGENVFRSRDRSAGKKTLLMMDHYVPQFDKDAGSKTTFQYLQLFTSLGFNIKFIGENFYRHEPYTTVLQQMGIEVLYGPWYRDNWKQWFVDNADQFDYIYLNRPHISIGVIDFFKKHSTATLLYYGHDLHFLREQKRYDLEKDKALLDSVEKWKQTEMYLFHQSDIILTPSLDEQKIISSLDPAFNVHVIRPYIYKDTAPEIRSFATRKDLLFVGGFNHTPNTDAVLWFVGEVWTTIAQKNEEVRFIIAGSNPPDIIKDLASERIIVKGYVSDKELESLYNNVRMVVVPLRYGAGVKGKTVEAMRYGLPIVTTQTGVEGLPGDYSFLKPTDNTADFARQVLEDYKDEKQLLDASARNIQYIREYFSENEAKRILKQILNHVKTRPFRVIV